MTSFTCPVDGAVLVPVERSGIEIDHCPSCRGVWLDRGELDKILERNAAPAPEPQYREARPAYDSRSHGGHHSPKRRKSFLEDLFD